jgi:DNA polymerase-3 subunit epsilon
VSPTHRALDDALATVDVLHALIGRVGSLGITTLEELKDFSNKKSSIRTKKELDSI